MAPRQGAFLFAAERGLALRFGHPECKIPRHLGMEVAD